MKNEADAIDFETGEVLERRSLSQNARLHAMLTDLSVQVEFAGNRLDVEGWKRLLLGAYYGQVVLPNPLDERKAPIVLNKQRSSTLGKRGDDSMADFLTAIQAFGDERGVVWGDQ